MIRGLLVAAALGVACAFPAHAAYWSLFNVEGESGLTAQYVTYGSLPDMLGDTNRLGVFDPAAGGAGRNIVGSGSDVRGGDAPVPAPATLALMGAGFAGLGLARRRQSPGGMR